VSLARLTELAESDWFVSEELFRRTAQAETARLNSYGYGVDCELFGVCFDSGGFALLQCNTGTGQVHKTSVVCHPDGSFSLSDGKAFSSVAEIARAKLEEGAEVREGSRWINSNNVRVQKIRMLDQVSTLMSRSVPTSIPSNISATAPQDGGSVTDNSNAPPASAWTVAQLNSLLSGYSYCFVSEVQRIFPSSNAIEWTKLLQWTLQLPSDAGFAWDERNRIFEALRHMFVEAGREFA
jgi:hypothetical protein